MTDITSVKKEIIDVLKADPVLQALLTKDQRGEWPVYHSFVQHKIHKPCITVEDVTGQAEVSGLNDAYDGSARYEWNHAVIQVDCWSSRHAEERDKLQTAVQRCLLKNAVGSVLYVHEPTVLALDEMDVKPPLWRKSLRFKVMYVLEVVAD